MNSDREEDSSSSDEEYIPPAKLAKEDDSGDSSSDSEDESECDDSAVESEGPVLNGSAPRSLRSKRGKIVESEEIGTSKSETDNADKKAKEDAIWNDFLAEVDQAKSSKAPIETTEVVRKYRFAGEEVQVTERLVPNSNDSKTRIPPTSAAVPPKKTENESIKSSLQNPSIPKLGLNTKSNLSNALQNLRSLSSAKPPKLTTLEKSRLDWQNFVRKEDLEDDLRAHNKGKQGYLERQAFVDRATEREYEYQKAQMKRKH